MRIIFVVLGGIGDVVVASPLIVQVSKYYPDAEKYLLVLKGAQKEVFKDSPYIDKIIEFDYFKRSPTSKYKRKIPYFKEMATLLKLKFKGFDLSITPYPYKSKLNNMATKVINAKRRVGFEMDSYTDKVKIIDRTYEKEDIHNAEQCLNLLKPLSIPQPKNPKLFFQINDEDREFIKKWLNNLKGLDSKKKIFCFHAVSYWKRKTKTWDPNKFVALADTLINDYNAQVIFLGTEDEREQIDNMRSKMKNPSFEAIGLTLKQTAALIEKATLFVGNDSGLMHISASVGIPTVVFTRPFGYNSLRPFNCPHLYLAKKMPDPLIKKMKEEQEKFGRNWTEEMDEKYFKTISFDRTLKEIRANEKVWGLK
jgi:ADP-heptose:LPS heptosyltransferase